MVMGHHPSSNHPAVNEQLEASSLSVDAATLSNAHQAFAQAASSPTVGMSVDASLAVLDAIITHDAPRVEDARTIHSADAVSGPAVASPLDAMVPSNAPTRALHTPAPDSPHVHTEPAAHIEKPSRSLQVQPQLTGSLLVEVNPWAQVAIAGQKQTYTTPVTITLAVGHHHVVLSKGAQSEQIDVVVSPNTTTSIKRTW
jgi:hypothetical protein